MNNVALQELVLSLIKAEDEDSAVVVLKKAGLWDSADVWFDYDNNPNNFATIGNQQNSADNALVEKLVNSVDAVMMRECLRRGVNPESTQAPKSLAEAQEKYFGIYNGKLSSIGATTRTSLSGNILLVATGSKSNPCYSIIDKGEGQTPYRIPKTFLTLTKNNKIKIPFVQGKFGMGGSGVLQFCGDRHNLQLILSKRDPKIALKDNQDRSQGKWGFTIIRRIDPVGGVKSSTFKYLAPGGEILCFDAPSLPILPEEHPKAYGSPMDYGTYIKLYNYRLPAALKTNIKFDLYYRLSLLLPDLGLPVRLIERRGYTAESFEATLSGLSVRLDEDKADNLEWEIPGSGELKISGQPMRFKIYAFKKGKRDRYSANDGVVFTINGQNHGAFASNFFNRRNVGMDYLSDSILILVDCSDLDGRTREDLFMNSRDRLREGELKTSIERQLEDIIKNHQGLKDLKEKRRREEIESKLEDSKPLANILEKIIKDSPTLSDLLIEGIRIKNPFKLKSVGEGEKYIGKEYPTFFTVNKQFNEENPKLCPINRRFRVFFETDAVNDYFTRDRDPGTLEVYLNDILVDNVSYNLWNGVCTVTLTPPEGVSVNDKLKYVVNVSDISRFDPFSNSFFVRIVQPSVENGGGNKTPKPRGSDEEGDERNDESGFSLPNIRIVRQDEWQKFGYNEKTSLRVKDSGENGWDFYINLDNVFLRSEIKGNIRVDSKLLEARYKYGLVLIGISIIEFFTHDNHGSNENDTSEITSLIAKISDAISITLLPMIASLGDLNVE